jgi:hypothetical protein
MSKRLGSPYRAGRLPHALKFKNSSAPVARREEEDWRFLSYTIRPFCPTSADGLHSAENRYLSSTSHQDLNCGINCGLKKMIGRGLLVSGCNDALRPCHGRDEIPLVPMAERR